MKKFLLFVLFCISLNVYYANAGVTTDSGSDGVRMDCIDCAPFSAYPFTLIAFVQPELISSNGAFISITDESNGGRWYALRVNTSRYSISPRNTGFTEGLSPTGLADDDIHDTVIGVFVGDTERYLYVNGTLADEHTANVSFSALADDIVLGNWGDSTPSSFYQGDYYEIAGCSRALTEAEVALYHDETRGGYPLRNILFQICQDTLEFYYRFDQIGYGVEHSDGDIIPDLSGNERHLTVQDAGVGIISGTLGFQSYY